MSTNLGGIFPSLFSKSFKNKGVISPLEFALTIQPDIHSNNFLTPIPNKVHNVKSNAIGLQHLNS
jgi:hypothetical protein